MLYSLCSQSKAITSEKLAGELSATGVSYVYPPSYQHGEQISYLGTKEFNNLVAAKWWNWFTDAVCTQQIAALYREWHLKYLIECVVLIQIAKVIKILIE